MGLPFCLARLGLFLLAIFIMRKLDGISQAAVHIQQQKLHTPKEFIMAKGKQEQTRGFPSNALLKAYAYLPVNWAYFGKGRTTVHYT